MNPRFRLTSERIELSEDDVEAQCLQVLRLRGYRVERLHAGRFRSMDGRRVITGAPKGTPDYIAGHGRHRAFYLETKRPGGELSPEQEQKILEIKLCGMTTCVAESVEELVEWLKLHERSP